MYFFRSFLNATARPSDLMWSSALRSYGRSSGRCASTVRWSSWKILIMRRLASPSAQAPVKKFRSWMKRVSVVFSSMGMLLSKTMVRHLPRSRSRRETLGT